MNRKDKKKRLDIFKRGLKYFYVPTYFIGPAENFENFYDSDFKTFASKHGITPKTRIQVWKRGFDSFNVVALT